MEDRRLRCSRRKFLAASAAALTLAGSPGEAGADVAAAPKLSRTRPPKLSPTGRKPLAVVTTVYRPLSHSYHIAGRFIHGFALGGKFHVPKQYVASMFVHQTPKDTDLSRDITREHGIRLAKSIEDALLADG